MSEEQDEAYHSGLYSLQSEADPIELAKGKQSNPPTTKRLSLSSDKIVSRGGSAQTPMTVLAGQFTGVGIGSKQCLSPTREQLDSGVFPSLPDSDYGSLRNEKETEQMETEDPDSGYISVTAASKVVQGQLLRAATSPQPGSPSIPPVAESVEVMTDVPPTHRAKRAIDAEDSETWPNKKTPRLAETMDEAMKPIRVKTIVSPAGSPRPRSKRGVSPGGRSSRSPTSLSVTDDRSMDSSPVKGASPSPGSLSPNHQPVVDFRSVRDLAQSASTSQPMFNPDQNVVFVAVHPATLAAAAGQPLLLGMSDLTRQGGMVSADSAVRITKGGQLVLEPTRSRGNSPAPPSGAVLKLLSTGQNLSRSGSPSSRPSPSVSPRPPADKPEEKNDETKRGNALLQVTEAHLATLSDEDGDTPLHLAIIHENLELTKYLVKLIVGVYMNLDIANNMRQTPLHLAVITRQPEMVQLLVGAGASVNFPDRKGNTALHLAALRKDIRILQLLAQSTNPLPNYNAKNFTGLTAIHVATKEGSIDVLKFFFQMGANKNTPDSCSGRTVLHYAVEAENFTLVNYLLENTVNVNAVTFSGNTPLHVAAGRRLKEIVALLMAYGANPAIANGEGDFPSDLPASLLMQRAKMHNAH